MRASIAVNHSLIHPNLPWRNMLLRRVVFTYRLLHGAAATSELNLTEILASIPPCAVSDFLNCLLSMRADDLSSIVLFLGYRLYHHFSRSQHRFVATSLFNRHSPLAYNADVILQNNRVCREALRVMHNWTKHVGHIQANHSSGWHLQPTAVQRNTLWKSNKEYC